MLDSKVFDIEASAENFPPGALGSNEPENTVWRPLALATSALAVAACGDGGPGGGGGGSGPPVTSSATSVAVITQSITQVQASRFLAQSTMGASKATIADVIAKGYDGWLTAQFAMIRQTTHWDWMNAHGYNTPIVATNNNQTGFDASLWRALISDPDQLRQRVGMALLDFLAMGIDSLGFTYRAFGGAAYLDVLLDNSFTNYRQILDGITYNAAMGSFLTYAGNRKSTSSGSQPDENFARELMQLFTLGVYQLNIDGSVKTLGSQPLETYGPADVSGLARIFTGLNFATTDETTPDRLRLPMIMTASLNETGSSTVLGTTIAGGGTKAIKAALDTIYAHPNLPPFVSKQLIQRLVTSNPSPGYISRVATVFANNGSGVRGDMQTVIRAILLDTEARSDIIPADKSGGKLREPVIRLTAWARAFNVTSPSAAWAIGNTSSPTVSLGQSMGRSPTVFNWFRPGYAPPDTSISAAGLVAPEFQITNEQTVVAYVNFMQHLVAYGINDVQPDYSDILTKASDLPALLEEINLVLAAGQLSTATIALINNAVGSISLTAPAGATNRVYTAILLTLAAPEFLTVQ